MVLPQMNASLIISILSLIISFIAIIATYFINRKLSSDNDKRKEFNEIDHQFMSYLHGVMPEGETRQQAMKYAHHISHWLHSPLEIYGESYSKVNLTIDADGEGGAA